MINASLLAITNMFAESIRSEQTGSLPLRPEVTSDTKPFSLNLANNLERPTTDNDTTNDAKSNPTSNQSPDFSGTFCKKAALQTPNEGPGFAGTQSEDKIKAETEGSIRQKRNPAENPAQLASAQELPITNAARQRRGGFAAEINPPQRLLAKAKAGTGQQQKEGETAANLAQLMNNSCLNKLTPFLYSNAGRLNAADKQQPRPALGGVAKDLIGQKSGQELMAKVVAIGSQKTTAAENPAHPRQTDGTAGSASQKTAILNYSFHPVQGKSLGLSSAVRRGGQRMDTEQKTMIGPENSAVIAKKLVDSASLVKSTNPPLGGPGRTHCKRPSEPLDSSKAKSSDNPELNVTRLQTCLTTVKISTGQNKGGDSCSPKAGRFATVTSIESAAGGAPSIEFERSSILNQNANMANNTRPLQDVYKDISEQITESIQTSLLQADKQITIRLNPPELGQVFVRFQERESEITGLLEVSKAEIRYEIEQALPQIIRTLTDYGVAIKRLDVLLTDQPEFAQSGQGAESYEQGGSDNPPWVRQRWSEAVTGTYSYEDFSEPTQKRAEGPLWRVTNGSINVLI